MPLRLIALILLAILAPLMLSSCKKTNAPDDESDIVNVQTGVKPIADAQVAVIEREDRADADEPGQLPPEFGGRGVELADRRGGRSRRRR